MFGCRCCDWPCFVSGKARAKWDGLGEIVTVTVPRSPWSSGGALAEGAVVPGSVPGAGMVQAGACRGDCVGCGWRARPPVVVVVCFLPNTGWVWVWFLSPSLPFLPPSLSSLPATPFPLLLRVCTFPSPPLGGRALSPLCTPGRAGPGAPPGGGGAPPRAVKGFREESEHGERVVLAPKGTESGDLSVGSWQHHIRGRAQCVQSSPLPPPSSPGQPGSRFLKIWSASDAEIKRKKKIMSSVPFCEEVSRRRECFASCSPSRSPFWGKPNVELLVFMFVVAG